jgi:hypothetical protein
MKWSAVIAALVMAAAPVAAAPQSPAAKSGDANRITLEGCVRPAVDKNQVIVTDVTEVVAAGRSAMPSEAHGRKVIFWLDRDEPLKPLVGHKVEVTGTQGKIEKSEAELKRGHQQGGGLVVEFEGPGHDVKASNDIVGPALGTSGRLEPGKNDVQTFLIKVKVGSVRDTGSTCG